jgi:hypothetical protein
MDYVVEPFGEDDDLTSRCDLLDPCYGGISILD